MLRSATLLHGAIIFNKFKNFLHVTHIQHSNNRLGWFEAKHCDPWLAIWMAPKCRRPHLANIFAERANNQCRQNGRAHPEGYQFLPKYNGKGICM